MEKRSAIAFILLIMISGPVIIGKGWQRLTGEDDPSLEPVTCEKFIQSDKRPDWVHLQGCKVDYLVYRVSDGKNGSILRFISMLEGPQEVKSNNRTNTAIVLQIDERTIRAKFDRDQQEALNTKDLGVYGLTYQQAVLTDDLYLERARRNASTRDLNDVIHYAYYDTYEESSLSGRPKPSRIASILIILAGICVTVFSLLGLNSTARFLLNPRDD